MKKRMRPAPKLGSIKIRGEAGSPVANQPAKSVAKAKPMPARSPATSKPFKTREAQGRRFYRVRDLAGPEGILPIGISTLWRWVSEGYLPQPIRLGARCSVWERGEIERAIEEIEKRINSKTL